MGDSTDARLGAMRPGQAIDAVRLDAYLREHLDGYEGPLEVRQYAGGQSNPTYALATPGQRFVLRRKPPGALLASAHAVDREYRIIRALAPLGIPVPQARAYCADAEVIGTPFYIMDHLDGRVFRDPRLPDFPADERAAIYAEMGSVLAALHTVDIPSAGLMYFGRFGGYVARQLKRWMGQYDNTGDIRNDSMEFLMRWLPDHAPAEEETTIVHGDYRLENLVFHPSEPRVIGVLDWELATLGNPLADLAYNCLVYRLSLPMQPGFGKAVPAGIPSEAAYIESYRRLTGRSVTANQWRFYTAFSLFRLAAISAGIYRRGQTGSASSDTAHEFLAHTRTIADAGVAAAKGS
jgi:aminoglycoside phosphotransferase (APT) family kinase protein